MPIQWNPLNELFQLEELVRASFQQPQLILKHSTRCSLSGLVLGRLEKAGGYSGLSYHLLDLIAYRALSNAIAERFNVYHESPQILLIKKGECVYDESHLAIDPAEIAEQAYQLEKKSL